MSVAKSSLIELLARVIYLSQRSSYLAQSIRSQPELLSLLVEEKGSGDANSRFAHDFKTLADVLIQEMIKFDLDTQFPPIKGYIYGEESSEFADPDDPTKHVSMAIDGDDHSLRKRLKIVLGNDTNAADMLTKIVTETDTVALDGYCNTLANYTQLNEMSIDVNDVGVWIDPIDGTNVYISGGGSVNGTEVFVNSIAVKSLECATVLIGVFSKTSHLPILGVVARPFTNENEDKIWRHPYFWGIAHNATKLVSSPPPQSSSGDSGFTIVHSSSDTTHPLFAKLQTQPSTTLVPATGAGHKVLAVALGSADIYYCSKPSTYQYDTCAPHALLLASNGGIVSFGWFEENLPRMAALDPSELTEILTANQIKYYPKLEGQKPEEYANQGGLVAYRSATAVKQFIGLVQ